ncbi:PREDICTED: protein scabrous-like [Ceratosolen solmsi marchali]|uniref:Protein scabrous-like n=1 Tax=Ceratosolen solmsi marchali TaxID=326594 RepID=A0AAJ6VM69_9HYME|nr:PREDICTED: protein scabrous-like [Ceratosolen solmsi marchali]
METRVGPIFLAVAMLLVAAGAEDLMSTVKLLQEQVTALLDHRQEDYNALEGSLKQSMEKNTELLVLRNEIKQLRKEMASLRNYGPGIPSSSTGNEAKNERLRLRWLGGAVAELQTELAEVLRTRNASEELAERARLRSEIELLRGDVAGVGRAVRDLGGRLARLEAGLGTLRLDVVAINERVGQLSRTCSDVNSQLSTMQIEVKSIKCEECRPSRNTKLDDSSLLKNEIGQRQIEGDDVRGDRQQQLLLHQTRHVYSRLPATVHRLDERVNKLEHKIGVVSRKRALLEKRLAYRENVSKRVRILEELGRDLTERLRNVSEESAASSRFGESAVRMFESLEALEERLLSNQSETKRELARLDVNAARKAAELSLTREELGNLKRAVQALSVSASKLQEKSDGQQSAIGRLNESVGRLDLAGSIARAANATRELEHVEDEYRLMVDALPGNCEKRDGLSLLAPGPGAPLLAACRKGWIVIGRRTDGTVDFDRSWNDYATGFGSPINEFWAGNEALHRLSRDNCTRLRIELNDIEGNYWIANYESFAVESEENGYRLRISGFSGNATDAMSYQNNMAFSAKDRDMDISTTDCAANYHGGWWFSHCQHANLNGRYSLGLTWYRSDINQWMAVASTELSVQRKQQCL